MTSISAPIWAIAKKDLRLLVRDYYGLFWVLAFPLMTALFFGSIFNRGGGAPNKIKIAVIDDDLSDTSQGLIDRLKKSDSLSIVNFDKDGRYQPASLSGAEQGVRKGNIAAFLHIKKGFDNGSGMFFDSSKLELGTDPSRSAERGMLEGVVMQNAFMGFTETFSNPKVGRQQIAKAKEQLAGAKDISFAQSAVLGELFTSLDSLFAQQEVDAKEGDGKGGLNNSPFTNMKLSVRDVSSSDEKRVLNGFEITFPQAIAWAFMGICTSFAVSTVQERTLGTLMRLRVAPLSTAHIMFGKGLACFITMLAVSTFLLLFGRLVFGVRIASPLILLIGLLCAGVAFVGLMTFIAATGKTERAVAGSGTAFGMLLAMLGGAAVPTFVMPPFMLYLSNISPFKWLIYSVEGAIWRGFTLQEMLLPCGILLAFGALFYAAAVVASRYTQRA